MTNVSQHRRASEYAFDVLAVIVGLLIAVPCFAVMTAPLWSSL